jgi:membrane-associated phospholipid phosphatase
MSTSSWRRAVMAVLIAGVALGLLAIALPDGPSPLDAFDPGLRASGVAVVAPLIDLFNLAGSLPVWIALVVAVALLARRRPGVALEAVVASVATEALTTVLRTVVARPRPPFGQGAELFVASGFPSGHVSRTVVLTAALLVALPLAVRHRRAWLAASVGAVAFMGLSRVFVGAHYTSDVLGGILLGCVVTAVWHLRREARTRGSDAEGPDSRPVTHPRAEVGQRSGAAARPPLAPVGTDAGAGRWRPRSPMTGPSPPPRRSGRAGSR